MREEIWRDVEGYGGKYQVSNAGRVKSFYHGERILKPELTAGYPAINLLNCGKRKHVYVHRLVAQAFVPNPDGKPQVNHINGDKADNRAENLEWVTCKENVRHAFATELMPSGADHSKAKLTNEQVCYIRENPDGLTVTKLALRFGVREARISDIQRGKSYKNAGGKIRGKLRECRHLSDEARTEIRRLYVKGSRKFGTGALAKKFGCADSAVWRIVHKEEGN